MRLRFFSFFLIVILSISIVGCKEIENQSELQTNDSVVQEDDKNIGTSTIQGTQLDPREGMRTRLSHFTLDLDGDGVDENIELYTAAERHEDGSIIWDDGQNWLLHIVDENTYYPLFQQYVQIGEVYYSVWFEDDEMPIISVLVKTGAGMKLVNYTYVNAEKGYKSEPIYDTGGINLMFSSFPAY